MQNLRYISLFLLLTLLFLGCGKKQVLERRLRGEWDLVKISEQTFLNDNLETEVITSPESTVLLNEDGTGIFFDGFSEIMIEWSNEKFEVILQAPSQEITFSVTENKKTTQVWRRSSTDTISGVTVTTVIVWELEKID